MIIHADEPILGHWCETCRCFWDTLIEGHPEALDRHTENSPGHQIIPVMPITAVHALRCVEHRAVQRYNRNATSYGGECAACVCVEAKQTGEF